MMKSLVILCLLISLNLFAQRYNHLDTVLYYQLDPSHLHGKVADLSNMEEQFNQGRMQIYRLKKGHVLKGEQAEYFKPIAADGWKVIAPEMNTAKTEINPKIMTVINELNVSNVRGHLEYFTGQTSRRSGAPGNQESTTYIEKYLGELGYEMTRDCFSPGLCNIWGTLQGNVDEYVLIEAHLDSVGRAYAGADDNGSGAAGLLELARVLKSVEKKRGLIIFATNGEESGLLGAKDFVWKARDNGLLNKIKYVINMDMIGYNENGIVDIETNREFENLAKWKSALANTYTTLKPEITMPAWGSDHVPFLQYKVPSILTIEHWKTKNPCYHRECDKIDTINFEYMMEILKLNVAASMEKMVETK